MNDDELRAAFTDLLDDVPDDRALPVATARRIARRRGLKLGAGVLAGAGALVTAAVLVLGLAGPREVLLVPAEQPTAPSQEPEPLPSGPPTPAPSPSPTPGPTTLPSSGPAGPPPEVPSEEPANAVRVVLRPDGLGFTDGGASTSFLPFGTDAATVRAATDRALLPGGEMATPDCGPDSSTVQHERLFLRLQGGAFVGWTTGSPGLTTADGMGVGSSLSELRAALPAVRVTEDTLGPEWSTESGLAVFLDGTADTSLITSMGAGEQCLFR